MAQQNFIPGLTQNMQVNLSDNKMTRQHPLYPVRQVFQSLKPLRFHDPTDVLCHTDLELHAGKLIQHISQLLLDDSKSDLVITLGSCLHSMASQVIEGNDVLQHTCGLVERTKPVEESRI